MSRDVSASRPTPGGGGAGNRPSGGHGNGGGNRPGGGNGNGNGTRPGGGNGNGNGTRPGGGNGNGNGSGNRPGGGNGNGSGNGNGNNISVGSGNNVNVNRSVNVVSNPVYGGSAWGWNHGVAWAPAYGYYGGGFWGAFAIGVTSAAVFGAIVNSTTHQTITSYQVQPGSPGATLLSNYQLTQTQCGPSNLVVIYGPNDSVICAFPNSLVAAGNYNLDSSNLSLTSM
jgi:hypothetical protein